MSLERLWTKLAAGEVDVNLEELWLREVTEFYGDSKAATADADRFKDQLALRRLHASCGGAGGLFGAFGWDDDSVRRMRSVCSMLV